MSGFNCTPVFINFKNLLSFNKDNVLYTFKKFLSLIININDAIKLFDYVKSRGSGIFHENNERYLIHDSHESYKNSFQKFLFPRWI